MPNWDYINWMTSQSKVVCDPTSNCSSYGSSLFDRKNDETFKANNGQYPDTLHREHSHY